ncbi:FG-GAP-like repeat-containing protein (plasmid) [Rhodobacteraceae bacterium M382]|nr:FG-GAP-like repeat-containing protein [Rhodobacteraceae bacterium M382]
MNETDMNHMVHPQFHKRLVLVGILIVALAWMFWTGSRYPALDEKAMMSGAIQLEDALSFEAKFPITPDMGLLERIFWSTLNWVNTNKKGMTFGILFAAAFLTATAYLKQRSFSGGFANSLLGLAIGTPLGVCVNCAAPIARGMYSGGMRAETVLSAMIASPTLNIVVLTMTFSLLPFYMAVTKIALSLIVILGAVPLICRMLPQAQRAPDPHISAPQPWSAGELGTATSEPLWQALLAVLVSYARNLWYIVKMTVPLMVLAGFLGTIAAVFLPPEMVTGLEFALWILIPLALVGLFLPVPIAFDVVVTGALLGLGMSQGYVMALLFTLGTFSIYSFFIVAQSVSLRSALMLSGAVLVLGILGGIGAQSYHDWQTRRALELLLGEAPGSDPGLWAAQAATLEAAPNGIEVTARPFAPSSPPGDAPFTRIEADTIGIDKPLEFSFRDMWPPFWEGRSLAAGDLDNDGDTDLVIASTEIGLYAYENDGHGQFTRLTLPPGPLGDMHVFNAVLADIDNDGWRDLFVATYRQGNYLVMNRAGQLDTANPQPVKNRPDAVLSLALSLADADRDGDLDVALGNWAAGWYRRVPGEESRNRILWNEDGALTGDSYLDLPAIPGETLSILFSDIDRDGAQDLLVGNDFEIPDAIYFGDGARGFDQITHQDGLIPQTTTTTMTIKSDDLTGNGHPELYLAQIAGRSSGVSDTLKMQPLEQYCDGIENPEALATCRKNMKIKTWYKSGNNFDPTYAARCQELDGRDQAECKAMLVKDLAIQQNNPEICALLPATQLVARSYCELHFRPARAVTAAEAAASIQQILRSNVLLEAQAPGDLRSAGYADTAETRGLDVGGWSWDTKIEDFDLDGDLDVYIVNGTWVPNEVSPSNLYFENDGSGTFTETSGPMGLEDYLMTASAVAFDADGDGDLDILTHPVNGPLSFFRNTTQAPRSVAVTLEDHLGNRDGIGAIIEIEDDQGNRQSRELQLGGGFMSFDAPGRHFGLAPGASLFRTLRIHWSTGDTSVIPGPFEPGQSYRIRRGG